MAKRNSHKYAGIDFTGQRHGRLTAIKKADHGRSIWVFKCDCGNVREMPLFRFFEYKSCGCLEKENKKLLPTKTIRHGMTYTRLYSVYCGMKDRCKNPNYKYFNRYGGRGIKICPEWDESFEAFEKWAYQNGYDEKKPGKEQSIDRIDLDGDYCPENCRWANQTEQVRNRSITRWVQYNGDKVNAYDFAKMFNITNVTYIYRHLDKGETGEQILEKWNAVKHWKRKKESADEGLQQPRHTSGDRRLDTP